MTIHGRHSVNRLHLWWKKKKNHCKSEYEKMKVTNRKLEQTLSEVFKKIEQITYGDNEETVTSAKEIFRFT